MKLTFPPTWINADFLISQIANSKKTQPLKEYVQNHNKIQLDILHRKLYHLEYKP